MDVPELRSEQDMRAWKREYNIRQRDAEWKKRQDELLMQKQVSWEVEKLEKENRLAAAREGARRRHLEGRVLKKHLQVEREYQEKCRSIEISRRKEEWQQRRTSEVLDQVSTSQAEREATAEKLHAAKDAVAAEMRESCGARAEKKASEMEMNQIRERKIKEREEARRAREAGRAKELKRDAVAQKSARVSDFAQKQVPMSSVLVSMLSSSPGVTSSNGPLDEKREQAIQERDQARNKQAAAYVRELEEYAEEQRMRLRGSTERQILTGERSIFSANL